MRLAEAFPDGEFADPATREHIESAEACLGLRLPEVLVAFYRECNGFREPIGNAAYLMALGGEISVGTLVSVTRYYWDGYPNDCDVSPDFRPFVFFGNSSGDDLWAMRIDQPHDVIAYHPSMGSSYEILGKSVLDAFRDDFALYDQI